MNITIIGVGRVGAALAKRLFEKGHCIQQVFSRNLTKAIAVGTRVSAEAVNNLNHIKQGAAVYILAIHDDGIEAVAKQLAFLTKGGAIMVHTSGATPIAALNKCEHYGVFYPLQTFSANIPPNFEELPFCISANTSMNEGTLVKLAKSICPNVYCIDEAARQSLHVSAVIVNNFSNHLFSLAHQICQQEGIDFEILKPLIRQTIRKLEYAAPAQLQTGPAARGDQQTIEHHLNWLREHTVGIEEFYTLFTKAILDKYHKES